MDAPLSAPAPVLSLDRTFLARSGKTYSIRPVRRSDEAALRDMFLRCSADDLRLRCFGLATAFREVFATRLARLPGGAEFAIAAVAPSGEIGGVVDPAVGLPGIAGDADYDIMVRTDPEGPGHRRAPDARDAARCGPRGLHGGARRRDDVQPRHAAAGRRSRPPAASPCGAAWSASRPTRPLTYVSLPLTCASSKVRACSQSLRTAAPPSSADASPRWPGRDDRPMIDPARHAAEPP